MKTIKFAAGLFILFTVVAVAGLELFFTLITGLLFVIGKPYSENLLFMGIFNLPLVLYVFYLHSNNNFCNAFRKKFFE